jgi:methionyl-tRNA synthetase
MPTAAGALLDLLAVGQGDRSFVAVAEGGLRAGARLPAPSPIFPRYVEEETPGAVR